MYRSDDGGDNWNLINENPKFVNNRPFYFQDVAVDSKDPDRLYNIYQPLSVSYDGGKSFDTIPMIPADETKGIHADFHSFWVNKNDPQHFIIGGDGGLGITYDHGKSWYFPESIPVAQFYHVGVDNDKPYNVYGGMQDNGNWSGPAYTWKRGGIRTLYWQYLVGGDGFDISPDLDNSRFGYGSSQNGNLYRYDKLTGYYVSIQPPAPNLNTRLRFNWNAAFARDPLNSNKVYYGSQYVHVTEDKGATWKIISPDLTTNNLEHQKEDYGGLTLDVSGAEMYNSLLTIAPSAIDENIIWAGTDDGQVQLTINGGSSWKNITGSIKGMPKEAWIAQIEASIFDKNTAWMVVNNYRKGDYSPYLFKTENLGKSWTRLVDDSKVKGYALSFIQDPVEPNLVFLGTENGLWFSGDEGYNWQQFTNGFPAVSTMDLKIQETESALIVGTFGRAIWVLDDLKSLREIVGNRLKQKITALPINDVVQVKGLFINPPGNIWTGFNTTFEGENRVFQEVEIPFYLSQAPDSLSVVKAEIYDPQDNYINSLDTKNLMKGLNYLSWKLDEKSSSSNPEDTRGISVLPGDYSIILSIDSHSDKSSIKVISDPRFDTSAEIDKDLYSFRKQVKVQVDSLNVILKSVDAMLTSLKGLEKEQKLNSSENDTVESSVNKEMKAKLKALRTLGQDPKPERQVGAWQSFKSTPYSKIQELQAISAAQVSLISEQHKEQLMQANLLVSSYGARVNKFIKAEWDPFITATNTNSIEKQ